LYAIAATKVLWIVTVAGETFAPAGGRKPQQGVLSHALL